MNHHALLTGWVNQAFAELAQRAHQRLPQSAPRLTARLTTLAKGGEPASYFLHPKAFPTLALPLWLEQALTDKVEEPLQRELVRSSLAGYYLIRIIDNAMDEKQPEDLALLPALPFLQDEFRAPYERLFPPGSPFWGHFQRIWDQTHDAAICDGLLTDIDLATFERVCARKVGAAALPLTAVALRHGRQQLTPQWSQLVGRLGAWHQLRNDLGDWQRDERSGNLTYFLAEGRRRKREDQTLGGWVVEEGLSWGLELLGLWLGRLVEDAGALGSGPLTGYLNGQQAELAQLTQQTRAGLQAMKLLLSAGRRSS